MTDATRKANGGVEAGQLVGAGSVTITPRGHNPDDPISRSNPTTE